MKKEVNPTIGLLVIGVIVVLIGYAAWRFFFPPSSLPPLPPELRPGAFNQVPQPANGQPGRK
jgi:hypothetical protein